MIGYYYKPQLAPLLFNGKYKFKVRNNYEKFNYR